MPTSYRRTCQVDNDNCSSLQASKGQKWHLHSHPEKLKRDLAFGIDQDFPRTGSFDLLQCHMRVNFNESMSVFLYVPKFATFKANIMKAFILNIKQVVLNGELRHMFFHKSISIKLHANLSRFTSSSTTSSHRALIMLKSTFIVFLRSLPIRQRNILSKYSTGRLGILTHIWLTFQ